MSAEALEAALNAAGFPCTVEARDRLAVIVPGGPGTWGEACTRRSFVQLGREHGFTHVAVELSPAGAALPRD
jgi:hypothetical protein